MDRHAGGSAIDRVLVEMLRSSDGPISLDENDRIIAVRAAQTVKEMLSTATAVPVNASGSTPVRMLTIEQFRQVTEPIVAEMMAATRQAIDAADPPPGKPLWVVLAGGGARMPILRRPFEEALGIRPWIPDDPDMAAVSGALHDADFR